MPTCAPARLNATSPMDRHDKQAVKHAGIAGMQFEQQRGQQRGNDQKDWRGVDKHARRAAEQHIADDAAADGGEQRHDHNAEQIEPLAHAHQIARDRKGHRADVVDPFKVQQRIHLVLYRPEPAQSRAGGS